MEEKDEIIKIAIAVKFSKDPDKIYLVTCSGDPISISCQEDLSDVEFKYGYDHCLLSAIKANISSGGFWENVRRVNGSDEAILSIRIVYLNESGKVIKIGPRTKMYALVVFLNMKFILIDDKYICNSYGDWYGVMIKEDMIINPNFVIFSEMYENIENTMKYKPGIDGFGLIELMEANNKLILKL